MPLICAFFVAFCMFLLLSCLWRSIVCSMRKTLYQKTAQHQKLSQISGHDINFKHFYFYFYVHITFAFSVSCFLLANSLISACFNLCFCFSNVVYPKSVMPNAQSICFCCTPEKKHQKNIYYFGLEMPKLNYKIRFFQISWFLNNSTI